MQWKDQEWGNQKGQVGLFTAFADGVAVYTTPVAPHSLTTFSDTVRLPLGVQSLEFKYRVGGGGGHTLTIKNFAWEWKPPPHGGCCQRSLTDSRVAAWEYPNGVPIALESKTIGCSRNTWMPHTTYNPDTEKCDPVAW